jgi:hypothetical protein
MILCTTIIRMVICIMALAKAKRKGDPVKDNLIRIGLVTMAVGVLLLASSCTTVTNRADDVYCLRP